MLLNDITLSHVRHDCSLKRHLHLSLYYSRNFPPCWIIPQRQQRQKVLQSEHPKAANTSIMKYIYLHCLISRLTNAKKIFKLKQSSPGLSVLYILFIII